jgi:hypothetical protein
MVWIVIYLAVGYIAYRATYPQGLFPAKEDDERERLRRLGRRRVAPLPPRREP